ncbi:GPI inositol deacylase [Mycoemilia scoparia]|uniref:GPI inositol-deacylase n=1 Tax=Mycoemilia scoparia TaxID=417184 RepID=A0A9W8A364_9FUNG|nr:GPI inositol deacylase [Mycoemilia scoparia]
MTGTSIGKAGRLILSATTGENSSQANIRARTNNNSNNNGQQWLNSDDGDGEEEEDDDLEPSRQSRSKESIPYSPGQLVNPKECCSGSRYSSQNTTTNYQFQRSNSPDKQNFYQDQLPSPPPGGYAAGSRRKGSFLQTYRRLLILTIGFIISCIMIGHSYMKNQPDCKGCQMSYMRPRFVEQKAFVSQFSRKYGLYLYREGGYDEAQENSGPYAPAPLPPFRIPILFIPGNCGSHKQIRSLASATSELFAKMLSNENSTQLLDSGKIGFDFFTVSLNEEFTALHGYSMLEQAEYVNEAIAYILSLYPKTRLDMLGDSKYADPASVLVIGHSMGGMVARTSLTLKNHVPGSINTLLTLSTPHNFPPAALEYHIHSMYKAVNTFWRIGYSNSDNALKDVAVVSVAGGNLDGMINSDFSYIGEFVPHTNGLSLLTTGIPDVWLSMDHQSIMWCRQLALKLAKTLISISDARQPSQTLPIEERMKALRRELVATDVDYLPKRVEDADSTNGLNKLDMSEFDPGFIKIHDGPSSPMFTVYDGQFHDPLSSIPEPEYGSRDYYKKVPALALFGGNPVKGDPSVNDSDYQFQIVSNSNVNYNIVACKQTTKPTTDSLDPPTSNMVCYEITSSDDARPLVLPILYPSLRALSDMKTLDYRASLSINQIKHKYPQIFSTGTDNGSQWLFGIKVDDVRQSRFNGKFIRVVKASSLVVSQEGPISHNQYQRKDIKPMGFWNILGGVKLTILLAENNVRLKIHIDISENPILVFRAKVKQIPRKFSYENAHTTGEDSSKLAFWPTIVRQSDGRAHRGYESKFWTLDEKYTGSSSGGSSSNRNSESSDRKYNDNNNNNSDKHQYQEHTFDIAFHGRGAYVPYDFDQSLPPLTKLSPAEWEGVDLDIWSDSASYERLEIEIGVNWYSSLNRIVKRYDMVAACFPFIWVVLMVLQQLSFWKRSSIALESASRMRKGQLEDDEDSDGKTSVFQTKSYIPLWSNSVQSKSQASESSVELLRSIARGEFGGHYDGLKWISPFECLELLSRRPSKFWVTVVAFGVISIVQNSLAYSQHNHSGVGGTSSYSLWKTWVQDLFVGYRGDGVVIPGLLAMGLMLLSFGFIVCEVIIVSVVSYILAFVLKLVVKYKHSSSYNTMIGAVGIHDISILNPKRTVLFMMFVALTLTIVPYHFMFLVLFFAQWFNMIRTFTLKMVVEEEKVGSNTFCRDVSSSIKYDQSKVIRFLTNRIHYQTTILLLWLQCLPFCAPELLVWMRNLSVQWYEDASSDHYILKIIGIYLLRLFSAHDMLPRFGTDTAHSNSLFLYRATKWLLIGIVLFSIFIGARQPYLLYNANHLISVWFIGLHVYYRLFVTNTAAAAAVTTVASCSQTMDHQVSSTEDSSEFGSKLQPSGTTKEVLNGYKQGLLTPPQTPYQNEMSNKTSTTNAMDRKVE